MTEHEKICRAERALRRLILAAREADRCVCLTPESKRCAEKDDPSDGAAASPEKSDDT